MALFLYDALDHVMFFQNAMGCLSTAPLQLTVWWMITATITGLLESQAPSHFGLPIGWNFVLLFHTARCTLSYFSYVLREIIDHSGLPPTSILSFTRTSPCGTALQKFLQPHDDNFHLLHHLMPRIPMSNLQKAHDWLVQNDGMYAEQNCKPLSSPPLPGLAILSHAHILTQHIQPILAARTLCSPNPSINITVRLQNCQE